MRRIASCALLLLLVAPPARAQTDPSKAWTAQRAGFIHSNDQSAATLQTRGGRYLSQISGNAQGWWADWRRDQPYDKGESYDPAPGTLSIPADPDDATGSPYGKNVAALTYGTGAETQAANGNTAAKAADMSDLAAR